MKNLLALALAGALFVPVGAMAATQNISESQARGDSGSVPSIKLAINNGLPIKMPSGYRVYKGWLDNDSLAEVDGDRPFQDGASIVYLVARTRGSGKLTLMVRDRNNVDHLFVLKLTTGVKSSPDMVVIRGSGGSRLSPHIETVSQNNPTELVRAGLRRSGLPEGSELWIAVEQFNGLVDSGMPADSASQQIGLDLAVIRKLIKLGQPPQTQEVVQPLPVPQQPEVKLDLAKALPAPPIAVNADSVSETPKAKHRAKYKAKAKSKVKQKIKRSPVVMALASLPPTAPAATPKTRKKKLTNHDLANRLVLGLLKAPYRDYRRGQIAIALLRRNQPLQVVAKRSGLSTKTLEMYIQKGGNHNAPKV
jgi:DNA-binding transcriptional MerR regulator